MEQSTSKDSGLGINPRIIFFFVWIISLVMVGVVSYSLGGNKNPSEEIAVRAVSPTLTPTPIPTIQQAKTGTATVLPGPTTTVDLTEMCEKTGPSQKKDYLVSYTIKENDTISSIAQEQLGSTTRDAEIVALNDNLPKLTVGSILYLPPSSIKESSGRLVEVSGKIVRIDNASWQLSYGGGAAGPGILIPAYWFKGITDRDSYKLGDCVTVLLDNGVKVFSIKKNS